MNLAPIALFVYNRIEHTKKTVGALQKNNLAKESELFVFSDGPKNNDNDSQNKVEEVREYIKNISGFKNVSIIEREENWGLAKSIIAGVTEVVNKYGKIIVLEDDLVTSPHFLEYMNDALNIYKNENEVISIHGYMYPIDAKMADKLPETFFLKNPSCWGWATWKRGWDLFEGNGKKLMKEIEDRNLIKMFDFENTFHYFDMLRRQVEGKNNSWAVRWYASAFLKDKLTLYPSKSLVKNIGFDGSGTHKKGKNVDHGLSNVKINLNKIEIKENLKARKMVSDFFISLRLNLMERIRMRIPRFKRKIKKVLLKLEIIFRKQILIKKSGELNLLMPYGKAYLHDLEVLVLSDMAQKAKSLIVEIGSAFGASPALFLLHSNKGTGVYSIDPFVQDSMAAFSATAEKCRKNVESVLKFFNKSEKIKKWDLITDYSYNVIKSWDKKIDLLFIDGDHRYEAVKKDFEDWFPFVEKGGVMMMHDSRRLPGKAETEFNRGWPGPTRLAEELKKRDDVELIGEAHSLTVWKKI